MTYSVGQTPTIEVVAGETLILSANISNFEYPLIFATWIQQGNTLSENQRINIVNTAMIPADSGPVISILQLNSLSIIDSGTFTFVAGNAAGNNTLTFAVTITGKCFFT